MTHHEFTPWPKTARLFRTVTITEKLDGTNAAVAILPDDGTLDRTCSYTTVDGTTYAVAAQSRKRLITPDADNYGFARWVYGNAEALVRTLGEGLHFGEWWGAGIQRRYGMSGKHFSLFNTERHADTFATVGESVVEAVPVLYRGTFSEKAVHTALSNLAEHGSVAAPGFMNPEGVCVYHSQVGRVFKVTLDHNDAGKWEV